MDADSELKLYDHVEFLAPNSRLPKGRGKKPNKTVINRKTGPQQQNWNNRSKRNKPSPVKKSTKPQQLKNIPRVEFKLSAEELLFFPKQYDPSPLRQTALDPDDSVRRRNYIASIRGKNPDEQRELRSKRDARYLHRNAKNESSLVKNAEEDDKLLCLDHLVGRCNSTDCGKRHQMRQQRLFGVCKFYISGVCKNGDLCEFMHEDFPCRYYHLNMSHPKDDCRFKHGGPLQSRLRVYFRKQIENWVKHITYNNQNDFSSTLTKFLDMFDAKQLQLEQEYEVKDYGPTPSDNRFSLETILSPAQVKKLAEKNITNAAQINHIPVDELLDYGLTMDQIYEITTNTCGERNQMPLSCETSPRDILSIDNINLIKLSSLEIDNSFQGFSEADVTDAQEIFQKKQLVLCVNMNMETNEAKLEANCDESDINHQESILPEDSDDSDNEFSLVINEDEDI